MNPDSAVVPHQSPVCSELQRLTLGYYLAEHPLLLSKIMVARILHPHDSPLYFHSFSIMPERPKKNWKYLKKTHFLFITQNICYEYSKESSQTAIWSAK